MRRTKIVKFDDGTAVHAEFIGSISPQEGFFDGGPPYVMVLSRATTDKYERGGIFNGGKIMHISYETIEEARDAAAKAISQWEAALES